MKISVEIPYLCMGINKPALVSRQGHREGGNPLHGLVSNLDNVSELEGGISQESLCYVSVCFFLL